MKRIVLGMALLSLSASALAGKPGGETPGPSDVNVVNTPDVIVANTSNEPVPVAVVSGSGYAGVNRFSSESVFAGESNKDGLLFDNQSDSLIAFTSAGFVAFGSCTGNKIVLVTFNLLDHSWLSGGLAVGSYAVPVTSTDTSGQCTFTANLSSTLIVPPQHSVRYALTLNGSAGANIGYWMSLSGYTMP